jgi:hypothetical protein
LDAAQSEHHSSRGTAYIGSDAECFENVKGGEDFGCGENLYVVLQAVPV